MRKELTIKHTSIKLISIIIGIIYLFLLITKILDHFNDLKQIHILQIFLYLVLITISTYTAINSKSQLILNNNKFSIKLQGISKTRTYLVDNIKTIIVNSSKIEIDTTEGKRTHKINYFSNKDKLKIVTYFKTNFASQINA